ncbi:isovaleryl-CoA dehydrogenase [Winslowiella iniecta]|uniref:Isovaleryl-CoA dehydrogenase n=1 Tax=Winslowiella iniecta TaxID=1560201 RepID=A0A0L7T5M2_9GAMM|nr:isovaleryl-CoA dehydrogenase [Winslowiella iniecta]KOC90692.1 isovaleryl-CoA dehydrogenase [Winslowiella iniecta]KOC93116.1 isovaleryl-CoA dehydrogenase [Winslowiella iniecta]
MTWNTHTVFNQPRPLSNSNLFLSDTPLREALIREGAEWDSELQASVGQQLGSAESLELGRLANAWPPELLRYNACGERLDEVRFHPAWHLLMQGLCANRVHNLCWQADARVGAFVARAARFIQHAQVEAGTLCPITMTFGAIPLLQQSLPAAFHHWLPGLLSDRYDAHLQPGDQKRGLLIGMGMTEKQGGTDVLSNTTSAQPLASRGNGEAYRLTGHKWFFSVPQSDAHLVLAQSPGGLSCFFLPRLLPDGSRNAIRIERLKEKLGNRSNASSEVEFCNATGWLLGEEGDGVRQILKMGGYTRFDCALGSHGLMRRALSVALYHAHQRQVMGKNLVDQPLMRQVLSAQALQLEGQTALLLRLARAWSSPADESERAFSRLFTPAAKYVICKNGINFVGEAMEVLGGIGYCEENELPRLYREMPVNSIWEGSGNVMCLDVLRVLAKQPGVMEMLNREFDAVKGVNRHFDSGWRQLKLRLRKPQEAQAREITSLLLRLAEGAQLLKSLDPPLADAWCRQMLDRRGTSTLSEDNCARLLLRATGG